MIPHFCQQQQRPFGVFFHGDSHIYSNQRNYMLVFHIGLSENNFENIFEQKPENKLAIFHYESMAYINSMSIIRTDTCLRCAVLESTCWTAHQKFIYRLPNVDEQKSTRGQRLKPERQKAPSGGTQGAF